MKELDFLIFFSRGLQSGCLVYPVPCIFIRLGARKSTQRAIGEARGDLGKVQWRVVLVADVGRA